MSVYVSKSLKCKRILHLLFPIQPKPENAVTIAVSSRVLFRTEKEQKVFEEKGVEEYLKYQVEHENEPLAPGPAFPFVKVREKDNNTLQCWLTTLYKRLLCNRFLKSITQDCLFCLLPLNMYTLYVMYLFQIIQMTI